MAITGADIRVRFGSDGAGKVTSDIRNVGNAVDDVSKKGSGFLGTMKQVAGGFILGNVLMAGTGAVLGFGKSLISGSADLEQFHTQLEVATGSSEKATKIMDNMISMAKKTPFEQAELIRGAANLESLGQASEKWMPIIADTAAGTNKSIDQTVQAVLDAQTGEYERLKEFGIRTKVEGDKVKFSFMQNGKEMVVEANNTSEGISTALMGIWDNKYDGAMEKLSNSFTGRLSTLKDNIFLIAQDMFAPIFSGLSAGIGRINQFFDQVSTDGFGAAFRDLAIDVGDVLVTGITWVWDTGIPALADWIVDTALPTIGNAAITVGSLLITGVEWAWDEGIPNLWDWIKDKAADWLGLGAEPIPLPIVDVSLDDINVGLGDGVDLWGDVEDLVSSIAGTGGSRVGAGGAMAGVGIRSAIKLPPVRVEVAEFDVDVSVGDLMGAIDRKFREATTVTSVDTAGYETIGKGIGDRIFPSIFRGIMSALTDPGALFAGGGGGGGSASGNVAFSRTVNAFVRGLFTSFAINTEEITGPPLRSAKTAIQAAIRIWWGEVWTVTLPSPSIVWPVLRLSLEDLPFVQAIKNMFTILRAFLEDPWGGPISIPTPDIDWPDMPEPPQWIKNVQAGRMPWDDGGGDKKSQTVTGKNEIPGDLSSGGGGYGRGGDSFMSGMASKVAAMASAIGGYAEQAVASITSVGEAFGSLDGTTATVSILGDNVAALAAVDASAMAVGGIDGMAAMTFINGDNSNAVAAIGEAAGQMAGFDGTVATGYLEAVNNVGGAVAAAINALDSFNGRTATAYVNVVGAGASSLLGNHAKGGYVRTPYQWVGEAGPELVSLPVGSYVNTASASQRMMAGGGGQPITIHAPLSIEHHGEMSDADFLRFSRIHVQGMATAFNNVRRSQGVA